MSASVAPGGRLWDAGEVAGRAADFCFEWNADNQLTRVLNNGTQVARYKYDAVGRRAETVSGGVATLFTLDGDDILRQFANSVSTLFVHGEWIDEPLAREVAGSLTLLHADALGSVASLTDQAGAIVTSYRYNAFGDVEQGQSGYSFTGREWDSATSLHYYRARFYDPAAGRFVSEDPIGFRGGVNFYGYVKASPATFGDPWGLQQKPRRPKKRFRTPDSAATAGLQLCPIPSISANWEWCGSICVDGEGMYSFTGPRTDRSSLNCGPTKGDAACPTGTRNAGWYHTHPERWDTDFSPGDYATAAADPDHRRKNFYVGGGDGSIRRMGDPSCQCSTKLPGTWPRR